MRFLWQHRKMKSILICGSRGYPARYGGFETLTQELAELWSNEGHSVTVTGFSSKSSERVLVKSEPTAKIITITVKYSGWSRVANMYATFKAARLACKLYKFDGAIVLNDVNFCTALYLNARRGIPVVIHLDGDESVRRGIPWPGRVLHWLMRSASLNFIDKIVVDSRALLSSIPQRLSNKVRVIKYGFPVVSTDRTILARDFSELQKGYFLNVARLVPENNVVELVESYLSSKRALPLVIVGKGTGSKSYESRLEDLALEAPGKIFLLDAQYDPQKLCTLIESSNLYIHGHEAGGTNPVLVTAREFASNVASHNNSYNREDCRDDEMFWSSVAELTAIMDSETPFRKRQNVGITSKASTHSWEEIADQYLDLLFTA
jgi:glycosyltransferase involved in cell wall biosynthesis